MADLTWPDDLAPYRVSFYLQPHVGGAESPITRTRKVYGLSSPRWLATLTVRTGYDGEDGGDDVGSWGGKMDALIAEMEGGLNRISLWDFRRPYPIGLRRYYRQFAAGLFTFDHGETFTLGERFYVPAEAEPVNETALAGATAMTFGGFLPGERAFQAGDYIGGDGRPHIILLPGGTAAGDGRVTVNFKPPLARDVQAGTAITAQPPGMFRLTSEDAGENTTEVGGLTEYTLDFAEDLLWLA